jgi:hypothetical protein
MDEAVSARFHDERCLLEEQRKENNNKRTTRR